jgi:ubiquinone/menaquinone biosynthesis C-methylase UbiE
MSELVEDPVSAPTAPVYPPKPAKRWGELLPEHAPHTFVNPFQIEDILVFDSHNLARVLAMAQFTPEQLAWSLDKAPPLLLQRVGASLPMSQQQAFARALACPLAAEESTQMRHVLLDRLFWELTYWKTPEMYEELVAGEKLHPGIFQQLDSLLHNKIVLDAGAGCGRASFVALEHGAARVYAVEPSPGLRRILADKLSTFADAETITLRDGDFTHMPLPDKSVDVALSCSAFTAEPSQGGEPALTELRRVTRSGGYIVVIWPRPIDRPWLAEHGFHYVALPQEQEMYISFDSWESIWRCAQRFYAQNKNVYRYLRHARQPRLPFSILGSNAPCDYCWLQV